MITEFWETQSPSVNYRPVVRQRASPHSLIELTWLAWFCPTSIYSPQLISKIVQIICCSSTQLCPTLCDSTDCSMLGCPVLHYIPEFSQIRIHWVSDANQPSHLLSFPSPPALSLSQNQGLFQWVDFSHQMAKVLELQCQSFQWISMVHFFRIYWFDLAVWGTLKKLLQHHNLKASILWHSAFFNV